MRPRDFGATKASLPEFVDGLPRETARDSQHAKMAFAGTVNAAETAPHVDAFRTFLPSPGIGAKRTLDSLAGLPRSA